VKYVRDQTGRFSERPHYEPQELDLMFEEVVSKFLKEQHGKVEFPVSTDDLTVLIERDTDDLDPYADLSGYGEGVEGVTEFLPGSKPRVRIAKDLSTESNRVNRYRTTLTHEYGHVHLHGYLFAMRTEADLFSGGKKPDIISCKRETMISAPRVNWLEWQAGYACGAILMPATQVMRLVNAYRKKANLYGATPATSAHGLAMIEAVVKGFQVSRDAARVRLSVLGVLGATPAIRSLFSN
jgi:hypothetical protein